MSIVLSQKSQNYIGTRNEFSEFLDMCKKAREKVSEKDAIEMAKFLLLNQSGLTGLTESNSINQIDESINMLIKSIYEPWLKENSFYFNNVNENTLYLSNKYKNELIANLLLEDIELEYLVEKGGDDDGSYNPKEDANHAVGFILGNAAALIKNVMQLIKYAIKRPKISASAKKEGDILMKKIDVFAPYADLTYKVWELEGTDAADTKIDNLPSMQPKGS